MMRLSRPLGVLAVIVLAACAHPADPDEALVPITPQRLVQVGHGRKATFVLCTPPQCPQRTPKTLASADAFAAPFADKPSTSGVLVSGAWNVPFAPGSAQLDAAALQIIKQVGPELSDRGRLTIIGRTDVNSPDSVTPVPVLAVLRAHAVRDSLKQIRPDLAEAMQIRAEEVPVGAVRRTEIVFESIPSPP